MNKLSIAIIIIIILAFYLLYRSYNKFRYKYLTKVFLNPRNAKNELIISSNDFKKARTEYPLSWALSFWIYIDDWSYKYNSKKYILVSKNCNIWLSRRTPDINISIPTFGKRETILAKNMPIQKWLHVCLSLENRHLDLWINGELHNSKHLNNVPRVITNDIALTPEGGFSGLVSRFRHYSKPLPKVKMFALDTVRNIFDLGPYCKYSALCKIINAWVALKNSLKFNVSVSVDASANASVK